MRLRVKVLVILSCMLLIVVVTTIASYANDIQDSKSVSVASDDAYGKLENILDEAKLFAGVNCVAIILVGPAILWTDKKLAPILCLVMITGYCVFQIYNVFQNYNNPVIYSETMRFQSVEYSSKATLDRYIFNKKSGEMLIFYEKRDSLEQYLGEELEPAQQYIIVYEAQSETLLDIAKQ